MEKVSNGQGILQTLQNMPIGAKVKFTTVEGGIKREVQGNLKMPVIKAGYIDPSTGMTFEEEVNETVRPYYKICVSLDKSRETNYFLVHLVEDIQLIKNKKKTTYISKRAGLEGS